MSTARRRPPGAFTAISSGLNHTCAVRQDGAAVCWGDDWYGQAPVVVRTLHRHQQRVASHLRPATGWHRRLLGSQLVRPSVAAVRTLHRHQQRLDSHLRPATGWHRALLGGWLVRPDTAVAVGQDLHRHQQRRVSHLRPATGRYRSLLWEPIGTARHRRRKTRPSLPSAAVGITPAPFERTAPPPAGEPIGPARHRRRQARPSPPSAAVGITPAPCDRDGTAACWGIARASPTAGETFTAISSGGSHTCALRQDGAVVCWGSDRYGQTSPPAVIKAGDLTQP